MTVHKGELEAVLAGLVQGVLVVDAQLKLISINDAAARLLEVSRTEVLGQHIEQVIRNDDLRKVVSDALREENPVEGHVVLRTGSSIPPSDDMRMRFVRVQDTTLRDPSGQRIGKMVALQDVTHLRHLEEVRRDFVANVSHEIKTPVTAIKAAAEMLLDDLAPKPEEAHRFLQIVARQADRLHALVEDLLTLTRIEQELEEQHIALDLGNVREVIEAVIESCSSSADAKDIRIEQTCDELAIPMDQQLLEQAMINLLDNAIKYSPVGGQIWVSAARNEHEFIFGVRDAGSGIAKEYQLRLFERFYRTDKARSRELGGTGLGLAIVKHVAQAHGGYATVDSQLGQGSTFQIHLPFKQPRTLAQN